MEESGTDHQPLPNIGKAGVAHVARGWRSIAANIGLLVGSLIVVGLPIELACRVHFQGTLATAYLQRQIDSTFLGDFTQPSAQADLRYELKPEVDVDWLGVRVVTSNDGRRVSPDRRDLAAPPDALKV